MADVAGGLIASMAAGIVQKREQNAAKLTPRAGETLGRAPVPFPNDLPGERVEEVIRELTRQRDHLDEIIGALRAVIGAEETAVIVDEAAVQKAREKAADVKAQRTVTTPETEAIIARMAEVSAEAKASVHVAPSGAAVALAEDMGEDESEAVNGWVCPEHGKAVDTKSPKGREFRRCPDCKLFELPS